MKKLYLPFAVFGLVIPYTFLGIFVYLYGLDFDRIVAGLVNPIATFFVADLALTLLVFWIFMIRECRRLGMKSWGFYILVSALVGPSFAFPLFLYFRDRRRTTLREKRSRSEH
jgi:putative effector of murein hydrolase LrgA (UPF0299 family)